MHSPRPPESGGLLRLLRWCWAYRWLAYSALLLCGASLHYARKLWRDSGGPLARYAPLVLALLLCIVVYVLRRRPPLGRRVLWMGLFWLLMLVQTALFAALLFGLYLDWPLLAWLVLALASGAPLPVLFLLYHHVYPQNTRLPAARPLHLEAPQPGHTESPPQHDSAGS